MEGVAEERSCCVSACKKDVEELIAQSMRISC